MFNMFPTSPTNSPQPTVGGDYDTGDYDYDSSFTDNTDNPYVDYDADDYDTDDGDITGNPYVDVDADGYDNDHNESDNETTRSPYNDYLSTHGPPTDPTPPPPPTLFPMPPGHNLFLTFAEYEFYHMDDFHSPVCPPSGTPSASRSRSRSPINVHSIPLSELSPYDDDEDVSPSNLAIPYPPDPYDPTLTTNYDFHVLFNYPIPLTDLPTHDPPTHDTTTTLHELFHVGMIAGGPKYVK